MKINKSLNLIVSVGAGDSEIHFHSAPILRDVFKKYSLIICKTFTELLQNGLETTGAQIAANHLEEVSIQMGKWEGPQGVKEGLLGEIQRLTNVLVLTESGWDVIPVDVALNREYITEDDWEEVKQKIVFFTLVYVMTPANVRDDLYLMMNSTWGTRTEYLTCTEFRNSLPTSTETKSTPVNQSSLPV